VHEIDPELRVAVESVFDQHRIAETGAKTRTAGVTGDAGRALTPEEIYTIRRDGNGLVGQRTGRTLDRLKSIDWSFQDSRACEDLQTR